MLNVRAVESCTLTRIAPPTHVWYMYRASYFVTAAWRRSSPCTVFFFLSLMRRAYHLSYRAFIAAASFLIQEQFGCLFKAYMGCWPVGRKGVEDDGDGWTTPVGLPFFVSFVLLCFLSSSRHAAFALFLFPYLGIFFELFLHTTMIASWRF